MTSRPFISFVLYEWLGAGDVPLFCVGGSVGGAETFAGRSVSSQSGGQRLDRDANDYRSGDGEPVGMPLAHTFAPSSSASSASDLGHRSGHRACSAPRGHLLIRLWEGRALRFPTN